MVSVNEESHEDAISISKNTFEKCMEDQNYIDILKNYILFVF